MQLHRSLIATYRSTPKEMFRMNNGPPVSLRPFNPIQQSIYDIRTSLDGNETVFPKTLNAETYRGSCP